MCANDTIHIKICVLKGNYTVICIELRINMSIFVFVTQISIFCTLVKVEQLEVK